MILPPRHSGGECGHVKRKLSPTSDLQFLTTSMPCWATPHSLPAQEGTAMDGVQRRGQAAAPFSWPLTVGEMVSPLPLVLNSSMMFTNRSREGAHLAVPSGKTSQKTPSSSPLCRRERPALLCRPAEGGGEKTAGGSALEDGNGPELGAFASIGRTPRRG